MSEEQRGSSPWKWIGIGCGILALIGVCTTGACLACGGAGAVGLFAALAVPAEQAKGLLSDVRAERFEAAYGRMSTSYQQAHDLATFTAAVQEIPALTTSTDDTISQRQVTGATARMAGVLHTPSGDVPVEVQLSQTGADWRVERIDVGGQSIP